MKGFQASRTGTTDWRTWSPPVAVPFLKSVMFDDLIPLKDIPHAAQQRKAVAVMDMDVPVIKDEVSGLLISARQYDVNCESWR